MQDGDSLDIHGSKKRLEATLRRVENDKDALEVNKNHILSLLALTLTDFLILYMRIIEPTEARIYKIGN